MLISNLHLIKTNTGGIVFHVPSYTLLEVNDITFKTISMLTAGSSIEEVSRTMEVERDDVVSLISYFDSLPCEIPQDRRKETIAEPKKNCKSIYRITIHISNDCNLRCKYCYAHGGNYRGERKIMTIETAEQFVRFCVENFSSISVIVFFGGEPFLNLKIVEFICSEFHRLKDENIITYLPIFGAVTNGTILNNNLIQLLKEYFSFVTVSIDGDEEVNDCNRRDKYGRGSYNRISQFIKTIKEKTNLVIKYESTYTDEHVKKNISYLDISSFLWNEFGLEGIITDDLNLKTSPVVNRQTPKIESFNDINFPEGFWSILRSLATKKRKQFCQISKGIVAISTEGIIYPCHMDNGIETLQLGTIWGDNIYNSEKFNNQVPLIGIIDKKDEFCKGCWAINICAGCTRKWFMDEKESYKLTPNKDMCLSNQQHIESVLTLIVEVRKNPELWSLICEKVNNKKLISHE